MQMGLRPRHHLVDKGKKRLNASFTKLLLAIFLIDCPNVVHGTAHTLGRLEVNRRAGCELTEPGRRGILQGIGVGDAALEGGSAGAVSEPESFHRHAAQSVRVARVRPRRVEDLTEEPLVVRDLVTGVVVEPQQRVALHLAEPSHPQHKHRAASNLRDHQNNEDGGRQAEQLDALSADGADPEGRVQCHEDPQAHETDDYVSREEG
mmetsp:Transcript_10354/g.23631  ORF Transcript_10354/g.23631 Transcript_10354/m.23631 type:complete len:206 (-) Transcript_10354:19-636(-)